VTLITLPEDADGNTEEE